MAKRSESDGRKPEELDEQELEQANGEQLPDRHALSVIRGFEPLPMPVAPEPPLDWE